MKSSILFIGAGRMAEAIISGLTKENKFQQIYVSNKSRPVRLKELADSYQVVPTENWKEKIDSVQVIVLAMPPSEHDSILNELQPLITNQFVVTIAAGIGPTYLEERLPKGTAVGWIMPNTAAEVGYSISLFTYGQVVVEENKQQMKNLLDAIGKSHYCSEEEVHQLTAITGSAPAFLYAFTEALTTMSEKLGVQHEVARKLVTEMIIGSSEMLKTEKTASDLREQVTTPGGATAEGLKVLKEGNFETLIHQAIIATNKKARGE
ncbi:pyrroline-5-carboxylate reductase [Bacillus weihaiensis]|uniref:Pyrroline-5-carboxylate reductase n=1 Tax=Bacillus weihaiensis TaxID=1547283 RepID=A0A1L3MQZ1_9BACI|nr:pyrroline-5-carboxylate reductase [Bacillus weihaiensis]APH04757.1 pyrroline-5-carboxylate reductase [Bacillus weihaiensis]